MSGIRTKRSYRRFSYWVLAIASLLIPIIIKLMFYEPFRWSISLLFPFTVLVMYPSWKFGLGALSFVNVFEYLVEYFLIRMDFHNDLLQLIVNSIVNCFLFVVVGSFILHYHKIGKRLLESEERYQKPIDFTPRGIIVHRNGMILYANSSALHLIKDADLVGKSLFTFIHPDDRETLIDGAFQSQLGTPLPIVEIKLLKATGEIAIVEVGNVTIQYDGLSATLAILNDITDRKRTESALAESEKRNRRLMELSPIAILVHHDGLVQYANRACLKLLGASSVEELSGKPVLSFSVPEYRKLIQKRIQELNRTGISIKPSVEKVICLDGKIIDVEVTSASINYKGKPSYLMMVQDVTSRKQAEEALRSSEEKYRLITENMTDLIGILDMNGVVRYASPSHKHVLGFAPEVYEGQLVFNMVHPDDIPYVQGKFLEMMTTKENKVIEFRYKHVNDHWVWVEAKGTPVLDDNKDVRHVQVVARDITERKMYEEQLNHLAYHDGLTGFPNRRLFENQFEQAIKEAERYGRKIAVMYMDMDKFKSINDTYGHNVGDILLNQYAHRVQNCLRESDILARQGGDEFTVLLPEIEMELDAVEVAHRILVSIQQPWEIGENVFKTTSSIGIAFFPMDGTTSHELLERADEAMYRAKLIGRKRIETYSSLDEGKYRELVY